MDTQTKETLMDELLVFLNNEIEEAGRTPNTFRFNLSEDSLYASSFIEKQNIEYSELETILNICTSRSFLKQMAMTGQKYTELALTESGQGRAISSELEKHAPPTQADSGDIHFHGPVNATGATQIGNHNTQNIESVFTSLIEQIDQSDAPEAEKQEAKSRLKAFLEHPLTSTAIGASATALAALRGGG